MAALALLDRATLGGVDAFIVESFGCICLGIGWFQLFGQRALRSLEKAPASVWVIGGPDSPTSGYDMELQKPSSGRLKDLSRGKSKRRNMANKSKEGDL